MSQEQTADTAFLEGDKDLEHDIAVLANRARDAVEEFVQDQPHVALGIAAAAGFIIGGGLTPRRLFRLGLAAGGPALTKQFTAQMLRLAEGALDEARSERQQSPKTSKARARTRKDKENG